MFYRKIKFVNHCQQLNIKNKIFIEIIYSSNKYRSERSRAFPELKK